MGQAGAAALNPEQESPQPEGGPGDQEQPWEPAGRRYLGMKCSKIIKGPAVTHGFELLRAQVSVPLC